MSAYLWLACAGLLLLIGLVLTLVRLPAYACCGRYGNAPADTRGKHLWEPHHGYYGGAVIAVPWWPAQVLGIVLLADDLLNHLVQLFGDEPYWRSPLHQLAAVTWYKWRAKK